MQEEWTPLEPDDIPPGSVIRYKHNSAKWELITEVSDKGFKAFGSTYYFEYIADPNYGVEILRPNSTWQPCRKLKPSTP